MEIRALKSSKSARALQALKTFSRQKLFVWSFTSFQTIWGTQTQLKTRSFPVKTTICDTIDEIFPKAYPSIRVAFPIGELLSICFENKTFQSAHFMVMNIE